MRTLLIAISSACVCAAQATVQLGPAAAGVPGLTPTRKLEAKNPGANAPLLGYVISAGPADLHGIFGTSSRAQLGDALSIPEAAARVYLPPGQLYSLVEGSTDAPLKVWNFKQGVEPIQESWAHPDLVAFSPRGDTAVLFSKATGQLQIVEHLPFHPEVTRTVALPGGEELVGLAVTDDAWLVAARFGDGSALYNTPGEPWETLVTTVRPQAWSFVPNTHDLVVADPIKQSILLLPRINAPSGPERVLSSNAAADMLAVTSDGKEVLAESSQQGSLWRISLASGSVVSVPTPSAPTTLSLLRGGRLILLSTVPNVSMIAVSSHESAEFQP